MAQSNNKVACDFYLFLLGLAGFADEYEVVVGGLFAVDVCTGAVVPLFAGLAKYPDDGAIGLDTTLLSAGAQLRLRRLTLGLTSTGHDSSQLRLTCSTTKRPQIKPWDRTLRFFNCLLF